MLFMTYRPKTARNVKAERITVENISEIATTFSGSARVVKKDDGSILELRIATLEGVVTGEPGQWVVRHEDTVEAMSDADFNEKYERARVFRDENSR